MSALKTKVDNNYKCDRLRLTKVSLDHCGKKKNSSKELALKISQIS